MGMTKLINIHGHLRVGHDVDALAAQWRVLGVVRYCLAALPANFRQPGCLGTEEILPWLKKYPDILAGLGNIDLSETPDPVSKVEDLRAQGFVGLKCIDPAHDYCDERYFGYYEAAQRLGMPILFHTGCVMACARPERNVDSERMRPYQLDRVAREFPDLKIIAAHMGNPHFHEALALMATFGNFYCDFTGGGGGKRHMALLRGVLAPFREAGAQKQELADEIFAKLLFGTDNPPVAVWLANSEALMEEFGVGAESRERFYWRNAAELFGWEI
jgi:predicted TIM-barrel fold metal-dependent hydrolase